MVSKIENKKHSKIKYRYLTLSAVIVSAFTVFGLRLIDWQIINTDEYKQRANRSNTYTVETEAIRGEIVDVNGINLSMNTTGYRIIFDRLNMEKGTENEIILKLVSLMSEKKEQWNDELPVEINAKGQYAFMSDKEKEIAELKKTLYMNTYATADNCMDKLIEKYECANYPKQQQRTILSVRYGMLRSGYESSMTTPYSFADNVSPEMVAIVSEQSGQMKGVEIRTSVIRKYVNGDVAPHIVGLTGAISLEEYEENKDIYSYDDRVGKSGIEAVMEKYLRGTSGKKIVEASTGGEKHTVSLSENASPGNTVFLTIDAKLQKKLNDSLKENVENAKKASKDCKGGAAVVLNIKDFSVLAASTYPSYDLDKYVNDKEYYNKIVTDNSATPLLNRAFNGAFTPGSIYKPVVACAALEEKVISGKETIFCNKVYDYYAKSGFRLRCMGRHGSIPVVTALAKSCNVFFAETGRRLGIESLDLYAQRFGLGVKTGIELPESKGVLAGPEYSNKMGSTWYNGNTSQAAIGQSDNMFTPLQLATYTATIANGGKRYKTHIVRKVMDYTRTKTIMENNPDKPELVEDVGISQDNINIVKEGMRQVVLSGTATALRNYPKEIAAKTGTAQTNKEDHTTFVAYAPYDNPEIAIAVVIEHGKSGVWSRNVVKDALDGYFFNTAVEDISNKTA